MKELAIIVGVFVGMMELFASLGAFMYTVDITSEFYDKYDDIKNGDTDALVDFVENRANDLVNMTIDETKDIMIDTVVDGLSEK